MITKTELIKIAKSSELNLYQQEKEYLLKLFLYYYYKKFEDAIFKGGTAIRFTKSLNRFSEDLDFNINITPKKFQEQIKQTLKEIEKIGIKNSFIKTEIFKNSFTCEIEFRGPLYEGTKQTRNKFRIDAGIRIGILSKPTWTIIKSEYPETKERFIIKIMNLEEILCEKIMTIFQRDKGRDIYDVWFLLNSDIKLNKKLLKKKLENKKLNKNNFTKETEYNRDLKHLTPRIIPYPQVKKEILEQIKEILN